MLSRPRFILPVAIAFVACSSEAGDGEAVGDRATASEESAMAEAAGPPPVEGDTITLESGLKYIVLEEGGGPQPEAGQTVQVHYSGWLTDGRKFDSSRDRGEAFSFTLGQGNVIQGWDLGVADMKVGEERRLIIAPELGYGARGFPGHIPPGATLIFDVELLDIQGGE